jgi:hypothetical protein
MGIPKTVERIPYRFEEDVVIHGIIPQANAVETMRNRKNDMKVTDRQSFVHELIYPLQLFGG